VPSLLRVRPDDPEYQRLAAAEAAYWDERRPYSLECLEAAFADGPVERYVNARFSGDPTQGWWETIPGYGPFRRGVVLGTSALRIEARVLETNPRLHLTFIDISPGALARRAEVLGARFRGRVETLAADLNFVALPTNAFDVVVSAASLHHVTNLEFLADQITNALRPGGYFFLQDYVGEPRFEFAALKKRLFESFHDSYVRRQSGRRPGLIWKDSSDLSPFCGVRSDEVLPVVSRYFDTVAVRTASALIVPLSRAAPADGARPPREKVTRRIFNALDDQQRRMRGRLPRLRNPLEGEFLDRLFALDDILLEAEVVLPGVAFGVYRKPSS
jgi:SAM-dependent methyltransferase